MKCNRPTLSRKKMLKSVSSVIWPVLSSFSSGFSSVTLAFPGLLVFYFVSYFVPNTSFLFGYLSHLNKKVGTQKTPINNFYIIYCFISSKIWHTSSIWYIDAPAAVRWPGLWGVPVLCKESSRWQHHSLDLKATHTHHQRLKRKGGRCQTVDFAAYLLCSWR